MKAGLFINGWVTGFSFDVKSCGALENGVEVIIHAFIHFYF